MSGQLPGWDRLRHGGLLLDGPRLAEVTRVDLPSLDKFIEYRLRKLSAELLSETGATSSFISFVLERVCGFDAAVGTWTRGNQVPATWSRTAVTGESVRPRQLWQGPRDASLPVFFSEDKRIGIGRGRRIVSQALGWLRAGNEHLALVTNGHQWRLIFAGLDYNAWCEWDVDLWFEEGSLSPQVAALRTLLRPDLFIPETGDATPLLLQAIRNTRKGQAELSEVLGERVREAVEILIQGHGETLHKLVEDPQEYVTSFGVDLADLTGVSRTEVHADDYKEIFGVEPADVYRAACRIAMRLVVILFAEARDLLPRSNPIYHGNYGLNGLLERLEREAVHGAGRMANQYSAWPRILALFRLVREGSHHPDLPVPAYGSELFAPGEATATDASASDGLSRALAVFEGAIPEPWLEQNRLSDADVHQILRLMTRTRIRIRQGRTSTWVPAPVDFSDLSTEYIGILYEGLLDYELKPAPWNDPVVFLSVGDQPALPLSRLENMDARALKTLFASLKNTGASGDVTDDEVGTEDTIPGDPASTPDTVPQVGNVVGIFTPEYPAGGNVEYNAVSEAAPEYLVDPRLEHRNRVDTWARSAVLAADLIPKWRKKETPERLLGFEDQLARKASQIVSRVILPGEWYLVRWGGTRKGSGSFYTRPGLAIPTVQRTLRPLAYDPPKTADGSPDRNAPAAYWTPRRPEEILTIKICDPASGSGTFPLAALRFLTDTLYAALQHHGRIRLDGQRTLIRLLSGTDGEQQVDGEERLDEELIPCPPDDDNFETRLKAVLRRHVVERCIYAVDLDPLAVELCRLALWIETMDRTLPFGFIDHKIKCGNALIGAWFDQFRHYPAMAWKNREGGDKTHSNGIHYARNARTRAIKTFVQERLAPDLKLFLQGRDLFQEDLLEEAKTAHQDALNTLRRIHEMPVHEAAERGDVYRRDFLGSNSWRSLKTAMDLWCACWFWPVDKLEYAPLPTSFANPSDVAHAVAKNVAEQMRFFHWELEFPDVFQECSTGEDVSVEEMASFREEKVAGFDAVLGNPPWENLQPNPEEYFSNGDPLFRSYGRLEKLSKQRELFKSNPRHEEQWLDYNGRFKDFANWVTNQANPFGNPDMELKKSNVFSLGRGGQALHERWAKSRKQSLGYSDPNHPFRYQMGRIFTYQLFLEQCYSLLRDQGRFGLIVPSGIYSDAWSQPLREMFLEKSSWEWLFGIENRNGVFPIHRSFKFNPLIVQKGGTTTEIRTAFMRRNIEDWEKAETITTSYTYEQLKKFSPKNLAILEIQSQRDLQILEKIYANSVLLGDDGPNGWDINYKLEFMMNTDAHLFPPSPQWEAKGYRPDEYSRWLKGTWRPIGELWAEMGIDPSKPAPSEIELEDWLFNTTVGPNRRETEKQFVQGHLLKPGDVARTEWQLRCAQPPYDKLPIPRADIPEGVILSRQGDAWIREGRIEDMALPLIQGVMLNHFDFSQKGWQSGSGLRARWLPNKNDRKNVTPQFLMGIEDARKESASNAKIGFRRISNSTNARTLVATVVPNGMPCGDVASVLRPADQSNVSGLSLALNALVVDSMVRLRIVGTHVDYHYAREVPIPAPSQIRSLDTYHLLGLRLNNAMQLASPDWLKIRSDCKNRSWRGYWFITDSDRTRAKTINDVIVARLLGLDLSDLRGILDSCDYPQASGEPKGFWRIDKDKTPEHRHTVLTQIAYHDLKAKIDTAGGNQVRGVNAFLNQNNGEGWLLPETLCLADYGLGHDDRAKQPQPVSSRLGPRFYDWQLTQTTDESWRECHLHARNLLGDLGYRQLIESINNPHLQDQKAETAPLPKVAEEPASYNADTPESEKDKAAGQSDMFK